MGQGWQSEMDRWLYEDPPDGGWSDPSGASRSSGASGSSGSSGSWSDGGDDLGQLRTLVFYGDEIVDSWRRPVDGSGYEGVAADLDRRRPSRPTPAPVRVEVDRTPRYEIELAWLARPVGSRPSLDELTDDPLPDEPLDVSTLTPRWRDRAGAIGRHLDRVAAEFEDPELATACRRALVRGIRANAGLLRVADDDLRVAAAVLLAVGKGNAVIGSYGTPIGIVQELLGLRSMPAERATRWAHVLAGPPGTQWQYNYGERKPAVPILGSPDLLTSSFRRHVIRLRDLALAEAARARPAA